ncbi:MAG: 3-deoxy-D-manno-octulosonic acid transferase [Rhodospirillaceae bacterium]|nr:3-deoxy-D-manno-octulosonic acid transferase [Rhodospirillaceae bacterium]
MMLGLYKMLTTAGGPLIRLYLSRRRALGKEDPVRFRERLGEASKPRPDGTLVWVHGASVGESLSMLPLIEKMSQAPGTISVLVTTGTVTSARLMEERLPGRALHQYIPVDRQAYVERFLTHWKPDLVLWAESEFWPNLVSSVARLGTPMVLINGRVSERSFRRWQRFPGFIKNLLKGFQLCLGQTDGDAERLSALGATNAKCVGNLKFAAPPLPADPASLDTIKNTLSNRPLWLAASTHAPEEELIKAVHARLKADHPGLLTIVVPRHPGRGSTIAGMMMTGGLNIAQRSQDQPVTAETDIYIADTLGELGLFYRLADIAFIGKSLVGDGGQNPLEAARLNCAIVSGPNMSNFAEIMGKLKTADACLQVTDEADLSATVGRLLDDGGERQRLANAALQVSEAEAGVLDAILDELEPFLGGSNGHASA